MNPKDKKFYEKWNRIRSKGMFRYMTWRALLWGMVLAVFKSAVNIFQVAMLSETEAEFAQYMMGGVWMNMLISFVVLKLFAAWGLWIVWTRHEKRFMTLVQVTNAKDIPKDYSVASPRGVKEKFPDYDWERRGR